MRALALQPILFILAVALHLATCHSSEEWTSCLSTRCKVVLSPHVRMRYKIKLPDDYDLDSHELDVEDECMGCKISVQLVYDGYAWLGMGVSPNGQMIGSHAVIGQPGISDPKAYYLGQKDKDEFAPSQAKIENGSIEYVDGQTVMDFTMAFSEWGYFGGDQTLRLSLINPSTFIYAHGSNGEAELKYHGPNNKLSHTINGLLGSEHSYGIPMQQRIMSTKSAWLAHGIMAFIAWGVFAPLAVATAILRDCNLPSFCKGLASRLSNIWMYIHVGLNTAAYVFTLTVFSLAVSNVNRENDSHWEHGHSKMGLAMFLIASIQIIGGYLRPANVKPPASETKKSEENDESGINNEDSIGETNVKSMKSMPRQIWELLHPLLGLALFLFGVWQMYAGIELYNQRYHDSAGSTALSVCYICWMGLWTMIITGGFIYKSFFQRRGLGSEVEESAKEQPQDAVDDEHNLS